MVKGEVVNDTSLSLVAICQSDGLFSEITEWPGCRGAISCDAFPVPDTATTYLMPSQSQQVVEYEYAVYSCKDGAMLEGKINSVQEACAKCLRFIYILRLNNHKNKQNIKHLYAEYISKKLKTKGLVLLVSSFSCDLQDF